MTNPWIRTYSGKRFHLLNPVAREMCIEDIAHGLSNLCRFTGQTRWFYSVAQHSCLVSDQLPKSLRLCGLLHDGMEALFNDISSQCKSLLPAYKEMERRAEAVMAKKWGVPFPFPTQVKEADLVLLATEFRDLFTKGDDWKSLPYPPLDAKIVPWDSVRAKREFLKRFRALY